MNEAERKIFAERIDKLNQIISNEDQLGERGVLRACMEPGYECRWQDAHGRCAIHYQLAALQRKQDEAFRAVSLRRLLTGGSDPQDTSEL